MKNDGYIEYVTWHFNDPLIDGGSRDYDNAVVAETLMWDSYDFLGISCKPVVGKLLGLSSTRKICLQDSPHPVISDLYALKNGTPSESASYQEFLTFKAKFEVWLDTTRTHIDAVLFNELKTGIQKIFSPAYFYPEWGLPLEGPRLGWQENRSLTPEELKKHRIKGIEEFFAVAEVKLPAAMQKSEVNECKIETENSKEVIPDKESIELDTHIRLIDLQDKKGIYLLQKMKWNLYKQPPQCIKIIRYLYDLRTAPEKAVRVKDLAERFSNTQSAPPISRKLKELQEFSDNHGCKKILAQTSESKWMLNRELSCCVLLK